MCKFLAVVIELALKNTLTKTRSFDVQSLELFHLFKKLYKNIKGENQRNFLQYSLNPPRIPGVILTLRSTLSDRSA